MNTAGILFGLLIATLIGVLFNVWRGGNLGLLIIFILLSCFGFWAGHFIGQQLGIPLAMVGSLNMATAVLGSLVFLFVGAWLIPPEIQKPRKQNRRN